MSMQIALFRLQQPAPRVHEPTEFRQVRCLELRSGDTYLTLHFDGGLDPSTALYEIDVLIDGLYRLRHEIVDKAPKPEAVTA